MGSLSDRLGVRWFLFLGPLLAGIGMLWLSLIGKTAGPSSYWTTYFLGFLIFALGMSVTVVPLTTAVMSSVDPSKSGIASGINNSISRIAGTFINALFGALAIYLFVDNVGTEIRDWSLPETAKISILDEAVKLGEAQSPIEVPDSFQKEVNLLFESTFLTTYKIIGISCAGLAFFGAFLSLIFVGNKVVKG